MSLEYDLCDPHRIARMSKDMDPCREEWEQLGFSFVDIYGDDVLCKAIMPFGWEVKPTQHPRYFNILDEKGLKRGSMYYCPEFDNRRASMHLVCRYGVHQTYIKKYPFSHHIQQIIFGNEDEKLFIASEVLVPTSVLYEDRDVELIERSRAAAQQFGDDNYPDWRNVHAYWGENKFISKEKGKI